MKYGNVYFQRVNGEVMKYKYAFTIIRIIYILKLAVSVLLVVFYLNMLYKSIFEVAIINRNGRLNSFGYMTLWCGSIFLSTVLIKKIGVLKIPKDAYMVPIMVYVIAVLMKLVSMGVI